MLSELSLILALIMSIRAEFAKLAAREYITRVAITELSPKMGRKRFATPAIKIIVAPGPGYQPTSFSPFREAQLKVKGASHPKRLPLSKKLIYISIIE